jgi:hypothetical protein
VSVVAARPYRSGQECKRTCLVCLKCMGSPFEAAINAKCWSLQANWPARPPALSQDGNSFIVSQAEPNI